MVKQPGLEQTIDTQKVMPYTDLSVTTQSGDTLCFGAADVNLPQLGVMVENNTPQRALWELLSEHPRVSLKVPERITEFDLAQQRVVLASGEACDYDVLIGADGANSQVAQAINTCYRGWDYGQRCLLAMYDCRSRWRLQPGKCSAAGAVCVITINRPTGLFN